MWRGEIHHEVARLAADPDASAEMIADVFERLPRQARMDAVAAAFGGLSAAQQWNILSRLFDDEELRAALEQERRGRIDAARRDGRRAALVEGVFARHALDTR